MRFSISRRAVWRRGGRHEGARGIGLTIALGCAAFAVACNWSGDKCTLIATTSLVVDVVDSTSGAPAAAGSTVVVRGTAGGDSIVVAGDPPDRLTARVWFEDRVPAGLYTITVRRAGYAPWSARDVRIEARGCHVQNAVHLVVRLQPVGSSKASGESGTVPTTRTRVAPAAG
jgi:hypothetical protein